MNSKLRASRLNKRRRWSWLIKGAVIAFIAALLALCSPPIWDEWLTDIIFPPKVQLFIRNLALYRTDTETYPQCEFEVISQSDKPVSIELRTISFFRDHLNYVFPSGQEMISLPPGGSRKLDTVRFSDMIVSEALKVTQSPATARVVLVWQIAGDDRIDSIMLDDKHVIKCTYWQYPIFESVEEASGNGAILVEFMPIVHLTDSLGQHNRISFKSSLFPDKPTHDHLDIESFLQRLFEDRVFGMYNNPQAFERRYGGIYMGRLASDTTGLVSESRPSDILECIGFPTVRFGGMGFLNEGPSLTEFIHYSFDTTRADTSFALHEANRGLYVKLIGEDSLFLTQCSDYLRTRGYRVGTAYFTLIDWLIYVITAAPVAAQPELARQFDESLLRLNYINSADGIFVFFPENELDSLMISRICGDLAGAPGNREVDWSTFTYIPQHSILLEAPFATPVYVLLGFSEQTRAKPIDSLKATLVPLAP